jgi:hypothetical protein
MNAHPTYEIGESHKSSIDATQQGVERMMGVAAILGLFVGELSTYLIMMLAMTYPSITNETNRYKII